MKKRILIAKFIIILINCYALSNIVYSIQLNDSQANNIQEISNNYNITIDLIKDEPKEKYAISSFDVSQSGYVAICSTMCEPLNKLPNVIYIYDDKMNFVFGIRYKSIEDTGVLWIDNNPAIYKYRSKKAVVFNETGHIIDVKNGDFSDYVDQTKKYISTTSFYCSNSKKYNAQLFKGNLIQYKYLIKREQSSLDIVYTSNMPRIIYYIIVVAIITHIVIALMFVLIIAKKKRRKNKIWIER